MSVLIIGETGQLARALKTRLPRARTLSRRALDLSRPVRDLPDADGVILAAAYTAVDRAEAQPALAERINGEAVGEIARLCAARDTPLVHVSTDYVFPGNGKRPWRPDDPVAPLNSYGRSKAAGERVVLASGAKAAILRTSWVFDGTGRNFLSTILRLADEREFLAVVDDQVGRPTFAGHLADACVAALNGLRAGLPGGLYHVSNTGEPVSWAGFASAILAATGRDVPVEPIASSDYPTPAKRPAWSVLDVTAFERTFAHTLPDWRTGLRAALAERERA